VQRRTDIGAEKNDIGAEKNRHWCREERTLVQRRTDIGAEKNGHWCREERTLVQRLVESYLDEVTRTWMKLLVPG
jgi:hypothetical protein